MVDGKTFDGFLILLGHDLLTENKNYFSLPSSIRKLYRDKNHVFGFSGHYEFTIKVLPYFF